MKKLIIAAAVICSAVALNAAQVAWRAYTGWVTETDESEGDFVGNMVYVFDENAYARSAITSALAGGDLSVLNNALGSGAINSSDKFDISGTVAGGNAISYTALNANASAYAIILNSDDSSNAEWFYATDVYNVQVTDAVAADKASFKFNEDGDGGIVTGAVGTSSWTQIVPEPTSGLLLLLGMGALALRRRRA